MMPHEEFRAALEAGDVALLRRIWSVVMPHLPGPRTDWEAEVIMHRARTETATISRRARFYSHRWLTERQYPSGLPDNMRPSAERMYPKIADSVGISLNTKSSIVKPALPIIRKAMEGVVMDIYSGKRREPAYIKARMLEAKDKETKLLFGKLR